MSVLGLKLLVYEHVEVLLGASCMLFTTRFRFYCSLFAHVAVLVFVYEDTRGSTSVCMRAYVAVLVPVYEDTRGSTSVCV
jgi:hypothetical protein